MVPNPSYPQALMRRLAFLFLIPFVVTAAPAPDRLVGSWSGDARLLAQTDGQGTQELLIPLNFGVAPSHRVDGFSQRVGCHFQGVAVPEAVAGAEVGARLDVSASKCHQREFNRRYTGTLGLSLDGSQATVNLRHTAPGGGWYELTGTLGKLQRAGR